MHIYKTKCVQFIRSTIRHTHTITYDTLHLRKPGTAPMFAERLLTLIPEQYHKRIVVHGHFYLKEEYKLKGIHLNGRNPNLPEGYKGHVSCSCHSLDEVKEHKSGCDYVFLSPVFNSISKLNYNSAYTAEELRAARLETRKIRRSSWCPLRRMTLIRYGGWVWAPMII